MLETLIQCQIEFRITDAERYAVFERFFATLSAWTVQRTRGGVTAIDETQQTRAANPAITIGNGDSSEKTANWLLTLRPQDLALMGLPQHIESIETIGRWRKITRAERRTEILGNPQWQALAEFIDTLRRFEDVPCELVSCTRPAPDLARIAYQAPQITPQLKGILESLLLCFGFFSVLTDDC